MEAQAETRVEAEAGVLSSDEAEASRAGTNPTASMYFLATSKEPTWSRYCQMAMFTRVGSREFAISGGTAASMPFVSRTLSATLLTLLATVTSSFW